MHNSLFNIALSADDGTISSIILKNDSYKMNWCSGIAGWGEIRVFDGIGKNGKFLRLYNAPWMIMLLAEMYNLTGNKEYLDYCFKSIVFYYNGGGYKFYHNAFSMLFIYNAFENAGMTEECKKIYEYFKKHTDNIVKNGLSYPKHEVNYEQTIVSPVVSILSDITMISGEKFYAIEAQNIQNRF